MALPFFSNPNLWENRNFEPVYKKPNKFTVRELIKQLLDFELDSEIETMNDIIVGASQNGNKVRFNTIPKMRSSTVHTAVNDQSETENFLNSTQHLHTHLRNLVLNTEFDQGKSTSFDDTLGSRQNWNDLLEE